MASSQNSIPCEIVAAIYQGVGSEQPWKTALSVLRELLHTDWCTLRLVTQSGSTIKEDFVFPSDYPLDWVDSFLREQAAQFLPPGLSLNEVVVSYWEEKDLDEIGARYQQKFDIDSSLTINLEENDNTRCILQFTRSKALTEQYGKFTQDEIACAKEIGGHFAHAITLRRRMVNAQVTTNFVSQALDNLGIAGLRVAPSGSIHILNRLAESLLDGANGLKVSNNRLRAVDRNDDSKLQKALLAALSSDHSTDDEYGLTLTREGNRHAIGVVIRSEPYRRLISGDEDKCALVLIRTPESLSLSDSKLIQQMFDFTPAEAHLAICIAQGQPLDEIERSINIRHNTARSHLRSIYQKAEVSSMAELIHLLSTRTVPIGLFGKKLDIQR